MEGLLIGDHVFRVFFSYQEEVVGLLVQVEILFVAVLKKGRVLGVV